MEFLKNVIVRGIWELKVGNQAVSHNSGVLNLKNMVPKQNFLPANLHNKMAGDFAFSDHTPKMIFIYVSETAIIHFHDILSRLLSTP